MQLFREMTTKNFARSNYKNCCSQSLLFTELDVSYELLFSNIHLSFLITSIAL